MRREWISPMKWGITCCLRIISDGCITKCDLEEQLRAMLWEIRLLDFSKSRKLWVKLVFPTIRLALSSRLVGVLKFEQDVDPSGVESS